jgi:hypothetical protein
MNKTCIIWLVVGVVAGVYLANKIAALPFIGGFVKPL